MIGEQADLFSWERPTAVIFHFPVDREAALIRTTALQLNKRHGASATKFWKTTCNRLHARMQSQGMKPAAISAEIERFAVAVRAELQSLYPCEPQEAEGGDAA